MISKFQSYYNKIKELVVSIKNEQGYTNDSMAFAHWYLYNYLHLNDQEIAEAIIDGDGDNGIDAIVISDISEELMVFQFKFPESDQKLNKEISQADILKTLNGFNILISQNKIEKSNNKFIQFQELLAEKPIYKFKLFFVSFNKGIVDNEEQIESFSKKFSDDTGNSLDWFDINKQGISNLYEKLNRKNSIEINIPYKFLQQAYRVNDIDSYIGVINANDLIQSIEDKLLVIFDENIRLFETDSKVNEGIKNTASSDDSDMFYFYNNGIVFICDEANNSPNSLTVNLKGASIVNGCQTVNSLANLYKQGSLKEDVSALVRIIKISDYDERAQITEYLNSQTPIKDSYFISNHTIVRDLQSSLLDHNYFLERQINERSYKESFGETIPSSYKTINLEDTIQYYTGYWIDSMAAIAKRGKSALFNKNQIEDILKNINSERVIEAYEMYESISKTITQYRKMRRNASNEEFAQFLNIESAILKKEIDDYLFINTADILLLNTCRSVKNDYENRGISYDRDTLIRDSIDICKVVIKADTSGKSTASLTKNNAIFQNVRSKIEELQTT
ncbi:MAG: AIPR family protein [Carnobacterium sp.]|nr:AIPR family protein [Carnobacterium sp.]